MPDDEPAVRTDVDDEHQRFFVKVFALFLEDLKEEQVQEQGKWLCAILKLLDSAERFTHADLRRECRSGSFENPPPSLASGVEGPRVWQSILEFFRSRPLQRSVPNEFRTVQNQIGRVNRDWLIAAAGTEAAFGYRARVRASQGEIWRDSLEHGRVEGPNGAQSQLLSAARSNLVFSFSGNEQVLAAAKKELVFVALSATGFTKDLLHYVETCGRSEPLRVRVFALDLDDQESWRVVYYLKTARWINESEYQARHEDTRNDHQQARKNLERARERCLALSCEYQTYRGFRPFWAYLIDGQRIIAGQVAFAKHQWTDLPASILVKGDGATTALFNYYFTRLKTVMRDAQAQEAR